jgi:ParB-like chromosome segregation protein Spo0J
VKWLGFKQLAVKSIVVDAVDIKRRKVKTHVLDLAKDIAEHGGEPIHAPTIRDDNMTLLCGRDRFAATLVNGAKRLWVHVVHCNDDEAKALELAENIYRRADNRAELIAQLVRLKEQHIRAEDDGKRAAGEAVSDAPQNSPKARARKEVARAAGVSTAAVRQAEARAAKSAKEAELTLRGGVTVSQAPAASGETEKEEEAQPEAELPAGFQAYGVAVPPEERDAIAETVTWLKSLELSARQVVAAMTDAEKHHQFAIAPAHIQGIRERAQQLGHALREAIPAGLCPYCKDQAKLMDACAGCGGVGVVGRNAGDHVPRELLATDPVMVAVNGQIVPLAEAGAPAKPKAKKNDKAIHVEVIDEVGAAPRELTLDRSVAEESEELF